MPRFWVQMLIFYMWFTRWRILLLRSVIFIIDAMIISYHSFTWDSNNMTQHCIMTTYFIHYFYYATHWNNDTCYSNKILLFVSSCFYAAIVLMSPLFDESMLLTLLLRRRRSNIVLMNTDDASANLVQRGSHGTINDSFGTFRATAYDHWSLLPEGMMILIVL